MKKIKGYVAEIYEDNIVVENEIFGIVFKTSIINRFELGSTTILYYEEYFKEDSSEIIGFSSLEELYMFKTLTQVSGIGNKIGLKILSRRNFDVILDFSENNDVDGLRCAIGFSYDLSANIIQKVSKVYKLSTKEKPDKDEHIIKFLENLGYEKKKIKRHLGDVKSQADEEDLIKQMIRILSNEQDV